MFRKLRRTKNAISEEAAKKLLAESRRGVFAVNGENGYPYAIPVNYFYDEEAGKIFFHGAKAGHKHDALKKDDKVCFTVFGNEFKKEGEWAPYVQSTVVFGRCRLVEDLETTRLRVKELAMKYYPSEEEADEEMSHSLRNVQLYEITIEHLCGKQVQER